MSITLITGTPGSGKTLYTVWYANQQLKAGRRLLVDGIRNLAVDHVEVDEPWLRQWFDHAQQQDLIIVDEAQRIWPPTSVSVKVPPDIEKLHIHRHLGVDFILITQHPQRLNKTIRDLVGRHVHVRRLFGMQRAILYEWDHCHNIGSLRDAVKTTWQYPRSVFKLYTSAEVHTKQKAVIPKALFIIPIALIAAIFLAYKGLTAATGGFGLSHKKGAQKTATVNGASGVSGASDASAGVASKDWRVAGRYAVGGQSYVVLSGASNVLRVEPASGFTGSGAHITGKVDGVRVAEWTGGASDATAEVGK